MLGRCYHIFRESAAIHMLESCCHRPPTLLILFAVHEIKFRSLTLLQKTTFASSLLEDSLIGKALELTPTLILTPSLTLNP